MVTTHLIFFSFFDGASVGEGVPEPPPAVDTDVPGGTSRRDRRLSKKLRRRLKREEQQTEQTLQQTDVIQSVAPVLDLPHQAIKLQPVTALADEIRTRNAKQQKRLTFLQFIKKLYDDET